MTVGMRYRKDRKRVQRIVNALDCANLYLQVVLRIAALARLISEIDQFLCQDLQASAGT